MSFFCLVFKAFYSPSPQPWWPLRYKRFPALCPWRLLIRPSPVRGLSLVVWALRNARSLLLTHTGPVQSCSPSEGLQWGQLVLTYPCCLFGTKSSTAIRQSFGVRLPRCESLILCSLAVRFGWACFLIYELGLSLLSHRFVVRTSELIYGKHLKYLWHIVNSG